MYLYGRPIDFSRRDNIDITYAYWLVLGLGFAICKGSDEHEQQNV